MAKKEIKFRPMFGFGHGGEKSRLPIEIKTSAETMSELRDSAVEIEKLGKVTPDLIAPPRRKTDNEKLLAELRASLKALEDKQAKARTAAREGMRKFRAGTAKVRAKK